MLGGIFPSTPWVGLPLYKFSCLLHKLNDSSGHAVFAALLLYYFVPNIEDGGRKPEVQVTFL